VRDRSVPPILANRLSRIRWRGERSYQVLAYSFSVRWNRDPIGDRVDQLLGDFAVDRVPPPGSDAYLLLDMGPRDKSRFRLVRGAEQLMASDFFRLALAQLTAHVQMRMSERTEDFLLVHAGAVVTPDGEGVLLPADTGSGKTTLVTALVRAGFGFLSDDIGVIDPDTRRLYPFPRAISLKEGSLAVFPEFRLEDDGSPFARHPGFIRAAEIRPGAAAGPCDIGFVVAPRYRAGATTRLTPLSAAETVRELWANGINRAVIGAPVVRILAEVASRAKGYRLVSGELGEAVNAVNEVTGGSLAPPPVSVPSG
jgi:hypothetical protein